MLVNTPEDLYKFMAKNIKYGFYSSLDCQTHTRKELGDELYEKLLFYTYYLQKPNELLENKCGICYDQVELERKWFLEHNYIVKTYYTPYHNHTFLVFSDGKKYSIFERSIKKFNGIHTRNSLEEVLDYYRRLQVKDQKLKLYEYDNVPFGCNFFEFLDYLSNKDKLGTKLKLKLNDNR